MGTYKETVLSTSNELLTSGLTGSPGNPTPNRKDHWGSDFVCAKRSNKDLMHTPRGVDVLALADGKVVEVIKGDSVGNTVAILHEGNILTRYQHLRDGLYAKKGDIVKKGQPLGVMGNTGYCTSSRKDLAPEYLGTHLHLGVKENSTYYNNGKWVNPIPYLTGAKVIKPTPGAAFTPPANTPSVVAPPAVSYAPGNFVKIIAETARYTNGQYIPARCKNVKYTVKQVGREVLLIAEINSWVYEADVVKVA
ncbi:MAG: M23 family metallopeptidase [Oscillospiraceae bacterium]|nr:M23 family metallopeptidase [Oscillospiraceae bacterium]